MTPRSFKIMKPANSTLASCHLGGTLGNSLPNNQLDKLEFACGSFVRCTSLSSKFSFRCTYRFVCFSEKMWVPDSGQ